MPTKSIYLMGQRYRNTAMRLREVIKSGKYQYTKHGVVQRIKRTIFRNEVEETIASGEIIEDYLDDKYGPTCLISGIFTYLFKKKLPDGFNRGEVLKGPVFCEYRQAEVFCC